VSGPRIDVVLRAVHADDLPILFEHQRDPIAARIAVFDPRGREAFMAHWRRILADATVVARAVIAGGELAGHAVSFEQSGRRVVGYWLGREFWGRGIATRALAQLVWQIAQRPLHALVAPSNRGSRRVLEKCRFRRLPEPAGGDLCYVLEGDVSDGARPRAGYHPPPDDP
jgi:RimJ/RimL family protein N-acetyltransferase